MSTTDLSRHVSDPARLAALRAVALLDTPTEEAFDRLSRLAALVLNAPVALVTLVDADRQFFKSCIGLSEPWATQQETPLTHSFCQHNRIAGQPLIINDARTHELVKTNLAILELDVIAYLGFPLTTTDGYVLGSFCVIDSKPRAWTEEAVAIIRDLAASVMDQIQLRTEIETRHRVEGERDDLTELNTQMILEIAGRKRAEQQQRKLEAELLQTRKMEAIGQLAGGIAHDLNNLLTPVLIYTSLLSRAHDLTEKQIDMVNEIKKAGLSSKELIGQLLAFSRKQTMQFQAVDLNTIIRNIEKLLRRTIPEDIRMSVQLAENLKPVMADAIQIERIVMNLVVNSADAMFGGGELTIETAMADAVEADTWTGSAATPGSFVQLTVRDSGNGMDEETKEHIFEPFFSTKGANGTGLGLATVYGIVQQHNGIIRFSSELGQGTTFRIYLPTTMETPRKAGGGKRGEKAKTTQTIFIAEDDEKVRQLTRLILERHGYMVLTAKNGLEALEKLALYEEPLHLLLADVVMPGLNGRKLFEKVSEERPGLKVLYMSGYSDDIISQQEIINNGHHFISKPFLEEEFLSQIKEILA